MAIAAGRKRRAMPKDPGHVASKTSQSTTEALQIQLGLVSCNKHPRPRRLDSR